MSNILTAQVQIRGTRAIIQHKFGPDALPLEKQEKRVLPDMTRKNGVVRA